MKFNYVYEAGRTAALQGFEPFTPDHFSGDSYYYYYLGYREIVASGFDRK